MTRPQTARSTTPRNLVREGRPPAETARRTDLSVEHSGTLDRYRAAGKIGQRASSAQ